MNSVRNKKNLIALSILIIFLIFKPIDLNAKYLSDTICKDKLIICINNIAINGELSLRGLFANFPNPILSTISVVDSSGDIVTGLADTSRWLGPNDIAENGMPIKKIWQPILEFHEEDPSIPDDPDLYNQRPLPLITEVRWIEYLPTSTMLVMDVSSSMTEELEDAKAGANLYVDLFRPIDRGGIIQFSGSVKVYQEMTSDTALLKQTINNARVSWGTAIYDALMEAIQGTKSETGRRAIIIYTDGQDNSSKISPQAVIDSARTYNLPIYTIALGDVTDEEVLKQIAKQTSALFFKAATAREMKIIFGKLSALMQNYYVMAHTSPDPFFNQTWRLVDVKVDLPDKKGKGVGRYFVGGEPMCRNTDVGVNLISNTDTSVVIDSDTVNAVRPGDRYEYVIKVNNFGPNLANTVKLVHHLPDSVLLIDVSTPPQFVEDDSLVWVLTGIVPNDEVNISLDVEFAEKIPEELSELISQVKIYAVNDTTFSNNLAIDTISVLIIKPPQNYDLSLSQLAITDTTTEIDDQTMPAVVQGNNYSYLLKIENLGPRTAYNFNLWDAFPDSVVLSDFNIFPTKQTEDTLFWQFDSLACSDFISINFKATVADSLPFAPFPLKNRSGLIAKYDTLSENNFATTTVYAIEKKVEPLLTDLAITFCSETDTFVVVDPDTINAVHPGDKYEYLISIKNLGHNVADTVQLVHLLPDSIDFISANIPPQLSKKDSLLWMFFDFQPGNEANISISVRLKDNVSEDFTELISEAKLTSPDDTTLTNNFATDTVMVLFRKPALPINYDLSMSQLAITDTTIEVEGDTVQAVLLGDKYTYQLLVKNFGPGIAYHFTLWDVFPDSAIISEFNVPLAKQNADSLFWQFDSLEAGDSLKITFNATVADSIPDSPFPMINQSGLIAENDTLPENNFATTTVYAIQKIEEIPRYTDLALSLTSETDTTNNPNYGGGVRPGEIYDYIVTIKNLGEFAADTVRLTHVLPDSVAYRNATVQPQILRNDSLIWEFWNFQPNAELSISISVKLAEPVPKELHQLISEAYLYGSNDTTLYNNFAVDTIQVIFEQPPSRNYDLSTKQLVVTDTTIKIGNEIFPAVFQGGDYSYSLIIENFGPATAHSFELWNVFPDSVNLFAFNISPSRQTKDSLFWQFDSLLSGDSLVVTFRAEVSDLLSDSLFPLINKSGLIAEGDTALSNNFDSTLVFAIKKPIVKTGPTDLALMFTSTTDTMVTVEKDTFNAVFPGDKYEYLIVIDNRGPNWADMVKLVQTLPDSVLFLETSIQPNSSNMDSLIWKFSNIQPSNRVEISVSVRLADNVPLDLEELISFSEIFSADDTTFDNNRIKDVVKILHPEIPPTEKNYNLAINQRVKTDTTILIVGRIEPAVLRGENYGYRISIKNFGPGIAYDFTIWDAIPDSVKFTNFSLPPAKQTADSIFWKVDSLAMGDSVSIDLEAKVGEKLLFTPFPILNSAGLIAEKDTSEADNISNQLIYAIALRGDYHPLNADIAVHHTAETDSFEIVENDTIRYAKEGEIYSYFITVTNISADAARDVTVTSFLPDYITTSNYQPMPQFITQDSLKWDLGILLPQTSANLYFNATVSSNMPLGRNSLVNIVKGMASNEDTTRLSNNSSTTTVINLKKPAGDWQPRIEATPPLVRIGDHIAVRIMVMVPIESWDIWVYLADGQIDRTYGDDFLATTIPEPNKWYEVDPDYSADQMYSQEEKEQVIFELRAEDVFNELKTAKAIVTVESNNDFVVDRNVFVPDQDNQLRIRFKLSSNRTACLDLHDITGTKITNIAEGPFSAGWNRYTWDGLTENGQKVGSGFYLLTFRSGDYHAWKKLMIVR